MKKMKTRKKTKSEKVIFFAFAWKGFLSVSLSLFLPFSLHPSIDRCFSATSASTRQPSNASAASQVG